MVEVVALVSLVVRSRVACVVPVLVRVGLVVDVDVAVDVDVLDATSGGRKAIPLPEADLIRTGGTPSRVSESRWPLFRCCCSFSSWSWWWAVCSCCPVGRRRRRPSWPRARPWCPWCLLPRREACACACDRTTLTLVAAPDDDDAPAAAPAAVPDDTRSRPRSNVPYLPPLWWDPPTPKSACGTLPLVSVGASTPPLAVVTVPALFLRRFWAHVPLPFDHLMMRRFFQLTQRIERGWIPPTFLQALPGTAQLPLRVINLYVCDS